MDLPRLVSKEVQHVRAWLLFNPWDVDAYGFPKAEWRAAAYDALLRTPAAEHRKMGTLALVDEFSVETGYGPGGTRENYALAASTTIDLPGGRYRFSATSDDGVRVYLDGRAVIDSWMVRSPSRDQVVLDLAAGPHALRVEYFQGLYGALFWLQIAPTTQPPTAWVPVVGRSMGSERSRRLDLADLESRLAAEIKRRPNFFRLYTARANFYFRHGQFNRAADDFASAARLNSHGVPEAGSWCESASASLQAGNAEEYRRQCREMLDRLKTSPSRDVCQCVVKECTFMPDAVPDLKPVMAMADCAVAPDDSDPPAARKSRALAKGMAEYRAGRFDAATEWLTRSIALADPATPPDLPGGTTAQAFLAMAEFKRGRKTEAEAALKAAVEFVERYGPRDEVFDDQFGDWIIALHAQKEAAALMGRPVP